MGYWAQSTVAKGSVIGVAFATLGCFGKPEARTSPVARTDAEGLSGYTYVPVDPAPVEEIKGTGCDEQGTLPAWYALALPDNAVRMVVEQFDERGGIHYGTTSVAAKGESYRVTVDYTNADTVSVPLWVVESPISNAVQKYSVLRSEPEGDQKAQKIEIPVYVGIGLRVAATLHIVEASANISGLSIISAEAERGALQGSLSVQTLGVNGMAVAASLPMHSELDRSSAKNAVSAIAQVKNLIYQQMTAITPRVVGFYLPFSARAEMIGPIVAALSSKAVPWPRPCVPAMPPLGPMPAPKPESIPAPNVSF